MSHQDKILVDLVNERYYTITCSNEVRYKVA
jgi:hypothetical protein